MAEKTSSVGFKPSGRPRHVVAIVAFDGVVLGDLSAPCEVFGRVRKTNGEPAYEVRICSATRRVRSEHVVLEPPWRLSAISRADTVVVPGIEEGAALDDAVLRAIRRAVDRSARVASICTGAYVLAAAGVLDGHRATTHWRAADELARRHPRVEVDPNVLYVDNGNLLTSAGAAAGLDLCLHLVRRDLGPEIAATVARDVVMPLERSGGQAQFIVHRPPEADGASLSELLVWLEQHLHHDLPLPKMARRAGMSSRTLSRRFKDEIGMTPARWLATARVRHAQHLLQTTGLSVERIAGEVGFGSATVLRERFSEIVGTAPLSYRRSFRAA